MKALFVYSNYSANERQLLERAITEMGAGVTPIEVQNVPEILRHFVRATPALIIVNDDLQGENLLGDGVDGQLVVTGMLYKRMEEEDLAIHQQETHRLDNMINAEKMKAIDDYTLELLEGGII